MFYALLFSLALAATPQPDVRFCEIGPPDDMREVSCAIESSILPPVLHAAGTKIIKSMPWKCGANACATCVKHCWGGSGTVCWQVCTCTFIEGGCYY